MSIATIATIMIMSSKTPVTYFSATPHHETSPPSAVCHHPGLQQKLHTAVTKGHATHGLGRHKPFGKTNKTRKLCFGFLKPAQLVLGCLKNFSFK